MRRFLLLSLVTTVTIAAPAFADEAAVKKMIGDYANAFNTKQLDTVIGYWTENGVHVDRDSGERTEGRDAIRADIANSFSVRPKNRIFGRIEKVRFVKPDVASVDGSVTISSPDGDARETMFTAILVEQEGKWMIDALEEVSVDVAPSQADPLVDLEWLVGRWVDEAEAGRVDTVVRWTTNRNFLLRSYTRTDANGSSQEGTQVIGFDPRSGEIRSWSFNSDGSFGDGTWSQSGEDWLIKTTQTLADGQAASGTFVLTPIGEDGLSMKLIGHEIEGVPQPASDAVTAIRVVEKFEPDATAAATQSN